MSCHSSVCSFVTTDFIVQLLLLFVARAPDIVIELKYKKLEYFVCVEHQRSRFLTCTIYINWFILLLSIIPSCRWLGNATFWFWRGCRVCWSYWTSARIHRYISVSSISIPQPTKWETSTKLSLKLFLFNLRKWYTNTLLS